jgi:CesT_Tir_1
MIATNEDLETFLARLERAPQRLDDSTFAISMGAGRPRVAVRLAPPVLVVQVAIGPAPKAPERSGPLFRKLLELNAQRLLHAAYGLEKDTIVLSAALELANLDLNELEAVLADVDVALADQVPELRAMAQE